MIKKALLICIFGLLVYACASSKPIAKSTTIDKDGCIPPLYDVAFPVVTPNPETNVSRKIPPQGRWEVQAELPIPRDYIVKIVSRPKRGELWLILDATEAIYRYSIESKQWKSYQTVDSAPLGTYMSDLFVASDGTLWGSGNGSLAEDSNALLMRFNDATDRFEFMPDRNGLLLHPKVHRITSGIAESQTGVLWFFADNFDYTADVLYSFDVNTHEAESHYSYSYSTGSGSPLAIGPDGSIWFIEVFKHRLVQYNPSTRNTRFYNGYPTSADAGGLPFDLSKVISLYFDHSGNLWLDSYGWLDFSNTDSPVWNRVVESPTFITDKYLPESEYNIRYPSHPYQSSNGWYWFTGGNGTVRLDLQEGTWCLMTTGISNVVEDDEHNLWIAVFGHLYKYSQ